jgi:hypothetical protein
VGTRALQIAIIGVGPMLILAWEAAELAPTAFHHSNLRLPIGLERALNGVLVTPRMHGIHHSIVEDKTNSNWSVVFSWWDRAHGTVRLNVPQEVITIGLPAYRDPAEVRLLPLLKIPLARSVRPGSCLPASIQSGSFPAIPAGSPDSSIGWGAEYPAELRSGGGSMPPSHRPRSSTRRRTARRASRATRAVGGSRQESDTYAGGHGARGHPKRSPCRA